MKKIILAATMVALLTLPLAGTALAASRTPTPAAGASDIAPRADETEWRYRVVDGQLQRRLWSTSWNTWLTEWENI